MFFTEAAIFAELKLVRRRLFVFRCCIVALLALGARKGNYVPHFSVPPLAPSGWESKAI
jgi:hypothetical protein